MIMNAKGLDEATPSTLEGSLGEYIIETLDPHLLHLSDSERIKVINSSIRAVARKHNLNPKSRVTTMVKQLNQVTITVIDSDTIKGNQNFLEVHSSAFSSVAHGDDNKNRVVRDAPYRISGMKNMNQRGVNGVHTSNLDKGLHHSERFICSCGTTFPLNSTVCRSCGTTLDKDIHEVVLRETTRNHTRHATHVILALDAHGRPYFSVGRVEFQKSKMRTKAGQSFRGSQWTDCVPMTFIIEGAKVEKYFNDKFGHDGIMTAPIKVFVTRDYFNYRDQGGEQ